MTKPILVDWNLQSVSGEDFSRKATRKAVRAGLFINEPIKVQLPDGSIRSGNRIRCKPKGEAMLREALQSSSTN